MIRGPLTSRSPIDPVEKAQTAWGDTMPDWVLVLAEVCQQSTQSAVAKRLNYSPAVVSSVLSNTYQKGDISRVEQMVRGALMSETVRCPVIGDIARNVCAEWQKRPFSTASSNAVRMFQACRSNCPNSRLSQRGEDDAL